MGLLDLFFGGSTHSAFNVGDRVRIKYRGQEGYVISVDGDMYMVSIHDGEFVDSYYADQLEKCW